MTTDIRARLVDRVRAALDARTANLPDSIPIAVPVGPIVDAVLDEMTEGGGVPVVPAYDAEIWEKRRWTAPFTQERVMDGASVYDVAVKADAGSSDGVIAPAVVFTARASGVGEVAVGLPPDDAEEYLMAGLAAVAAARRMARIDAPTERG